MDADKDSLMDAVFSVVHLPTIHETTVGESHVERTVVTSSHVETHTSNFSHHHYDEIVEVVSSEKATEHLEHSHHEHADNHFSHFDNEENQSEVSGYSKATSVSVHSSVSQKSSPIQHYDLPPVITKRSSIASSHHSVKARTDSQVSHDSESTVKSGGTIQEPVHLKSYVAVSSELVTPTAVAKSAEHDALIEQFKFLHGKEPSIISSVTPSSVHISDSEDSIAPSKLTSAIGQGVAPVIHHSEQNVLRRSHELEYTDLATSYNVPPSVQDFADTKSEDSFGFERVEYVDAKPEHNEPYFHEESHQHAAEEHHHHVQSEHVHVETYQPYHTVYANHDVPTVDFEEETHHQSTFVTAPTHTDSKQSRSNTASTYQSRYMLAHKHGPKITEELRPAVVPEEVEVPVQQIALAYVAPIPVKPPRSHEEIHGYNAYENAGYDHNDHTHYTKTTEVIKSTTSVREEVYSGPGSRQKHRSIDSEENNREIIGVLALRSKFEHGAPPPLTPTLEIKKKLVSSGDVEHVHNDAHHHVHQVGYHASYPYSNQRVDVTENHYDVPFEPEREIVHDEIHRTSHVSSGDSSHHYALPVVHQHSTESNIHSPAYYRDDQHHNYVPQIKVITEYRHIEPRHHYVEHHSKSSATIGYSNTIVNSSSINRNHNYVPTLPSTPKHETETFMHEHSYIPARQQPNEEHRIIEREHHYIPSQTKLEHEERHIDRHHNYVPNAVNTKPNEHHVIGQNQYLPRIYRPQEDIRHIERHHEYVPVIVSTTAKPSIGRTHHYMPIIPRKADEIHHIEREHEYVPLSSNRDQKATSIERTHNYLPLSSHVEETRHIERDHHFIPVSKISQQPQFHSNSYSAPHKHNYVPLPIGREKKERMIYREHGYQPLPQPTHSKSERFDMAQHHFVPLSTKTTPVDVSTDKVISEHDYLPLAPKKVERSVIKREHGYLPISTMNREIRQEEDVTREHHFIPVTPARETRTKESHEQHHYLPLVNSTEQRQEISRSHGYVPLAPKHTSEKKETHEEHHYLPLVRKVEHREDITRNHNYVPIAQQTEQFEKVLHDEHSYLPPLNKSEQRHEVLRSHGYVPLAPKQNEDRNQSHTNHHYLPPVKQAEERQELVRNHKYVPLAPKQCTQKAESHDEHHYLPPVKQIEQRQKIERSHNFIPHAQKQAITMKELHKEHHYIPSLVKAEQRPEIPREHCYVPLFAKPENLKRDHHDEHHYLPPLNKTEEQQEFERSHGYIPTVQKHTTVERESHENHNYIPIVSKSVQREEVTKSHGYFPIVPKQENVKRELHEDHHFIPNLHKTEQRHEVARGHGYVPLPSKVEVPKKESHEEHHYLPPVSKAEKRQEIVRSHDFVPAIPIHDDSQRISHETHQYLPPVQKTEKRPEVARNHGYVPLTPKNPDSTRKTNDEHHYLPPLNKIAKRDEITREHGYIPPASKIVDEAHSPPTKHHYIPLIPTSDDENKTPIINPTTIPALPNTRTNMKRSTSKQSTSSTLSSTKPRVSLINFDVNSQPPVPKPRGVLSPNSSFLAH